MHFVLRKAGAANLPSLMELYGEARRFMAQNGNPHQWGRSYPEQTVLERDMMDGALYLVCEKETGRIAAAFCCRYGEGDASYRQIYEGSWLNDLPYAVLHRVAAAPWAHGQGAASFCFDWAFCRWGNVRVDTHRDNLPMQGLLRKKGYQSCGRIVTDDGTDRIAFQKTAKLILASASPRRRELFHLLQRPYICIPAEQAEQTPAQETPERLAQVLALRKAREVFQKQQDEAAIVVGSDTIVVCDGEVFGKPADKGDAVRMLQRLSGRSHVVRTGVAICAKGQERSFTSETAVRFYPLSKETIEAYVATGEPMDKAGAYGIQGKGMFLVQSISGDYNTVIGLPVAELERNLREILKGGINC